MKGFELNLKSDKLNSFARKKSINLIIELCLFSNIRVNDNVVNELNKDICFYSYKRLVVSFDDGYVEITDKINNKYPLLDFGKDYEIIIKGIKSYTNVNKLPENTNTKVVKYVINNDNKFVKKENISNDVVKFYNLVDISKRVPRSIDRINVSIYNCLVSAWGQTDPDNIELRVCLLIYYLSKIYTTTPIEANGIIITNFDRAKRIPIKFFERFDDVFGKFPKKITHKIKFSVTNIDSYMSSKPDDKIEINIKAKNLNSLEFMEDLSNCIMKDTLEPTSEMRHDFKAFLGYLQCV